MGKEKKDKKEILALHMSFFNLHFYDLRLDPRNLLRYLANWNNVRQNKSILQSVLCYIQNKQHKWFHLPEASVFIAVSLTFDNSFASGISSYFLA